MATTPVRSSRRAATRWTLRAVLAAVLLAGAAAFGARPARAVSSAAVPATGPGPGVTATATPPPPGVTTVPDGTDGKVAGMAIPNVDPQASSAEIGRLHDTDGLNAISLFVWWWMPQSSSNYVERCTNPAQGDQQGCNPTEPDAELQVQIAAARQYGMKVILVPIFYCGTCEGGWRGTAQPSDVNAWFSSYRQFIDHYADLARQNGASTLFVGSEMDSLESQTSQWGQVISEARQHFSGRIGYEQNWDVLGNAHFLGDVDIVGVSAYFPLDDGQSPTLRSILGDWSNSHASAYSGRNWVTTLSNFARSTGKPILFGEVGYMASDYAGKQPFLNYAGTINWQLQSDLYQAVLETFQNQPWWAGTVWWEWYQPSNANTDDSRTPRGKTAETFMQDWYKNGWRPAQPAVPLVLSDLQHSPDSSEIYTTAPGGTPGQPASNTAGSRSGAASGASTHAPGAGSATRPGAAAGTARPGTGPGSRGAQAAAGAAGGAHAPGTAGAPGSPKSGSFTGTGRAVALLAIVGVVGLILIIAVYNGARYGDARRHPPSARAG